MIGTLISSLLMASGPAPSIEVAVDGPGLLRFVRDGRAIYAKHARLEVANGSLGEGGVGLLPEIRVHAGVESLSIDLEGHVAGSIHGSPSVLGRLVLAVFPLESVLTPDGAFLIAADRPKLTEPGEGTAGVVRLVGKAAPRQVQPQIVIAAYPSRAPSERLTPAAPKASLPHKGDPPVPSKLSDVRIDVKSMSEVAGPKILLGDIATLQGDKSVVDRLSQIEVGEAPVWGASRGIDDFSIEVKLRQAGFKPEELALNVPAGAKIERQSQIVPDDDFSKLALATATAAYPGVKLSYERQTVDFHAPLGKVDLSAETCVRNGPATTVSVAVFVDGKRFNSRNVILKSEGSPDGVKAGQTVKVILRASGAVVEIGGKTRTAGFVGQTVTVVTDTGSVHTATVTSSGEVEVNL